VQALASIAARSHGARVTSEVGKLERAHAELVRRLAARPHANPRVNRAFARVPRHRFVPAELERFAYDDIALPIAAEQTISQPSMVAEMLDALDPPARGRALEVGAGSGYAAALLGCLAESVFAVEVRPALAERAGELLRELGYDNVRVLVGDGRRGLADAAPFDAILVSAFADRVPPALLEQLAEGGRLAMPVGADEGQDLVIATKRGGRVSFARHTPCRFVPLVGTESSARDAH
jgi:protein-L-isoaspartate(D-aspartate) O-methyltransferase